MSTTHRALGKQLVISVAAYSAFSVSNVDAAEAWLSSRIKAVYPLADGNFVLMPESDAPSCTNTNTPKFHHVAVGQNGVSAEAINKLYAAALAAAAQRLTLWIVFDDATSSCYVNRLVVIYE